MFKSQNIKELEDRIYDEVATEIRSGQIDQGTWAKALAKSNGDLNITKSTYIKLRVNKLKDKSIEDYNFKKNEDDEQNKDTNAVTVVKNVALKNSYRFKFLSIALFAIGLITLFFSAITDPYTSAEDSIYFVIFLFVGLILVPLSIYTFYESHKINKINDVTILHNKIVRLFWIMIPTSLVISALGALSIIIGLVAIIIFFKMLIDAFQFESAYKRIVRKKLII
jgi:hypothetical protein